MAVEKVNNSNNNIILYTTGAAIAGGTAGAVGGWYSKPFLKNGELTDVFIKKIEENLGKIVPESMNEMIDEQKNYQKKLANAKNIDEFKDLIYNKIIKELGEDVPSIKESFSGMGDIISQLGIPNDKELIDSIVSAKDIKEIRKVIKNNLNKAYEGQSLEDINKEADR